jgi:hypothetical protein
VAIPGACLLQNSESLMAHQPGVRWGAVAKVMRIHAIAGRRIHRPANMYMSRLFCPDFRQDYQVLRRWPVASVNKINETSAIAA